MMMKLFEKFREYIQNLRNESIRVNNFDKISREIRDHIQNLKDKGINVNINNDQVNDLVYKIFKNIGKRNSRFNPTRFTPKKFRDKKFFIKI